MTKLIVVRGDNALRSAIRSKFVDFICVVTEEEEESALEELIAIDNRLSHRGALRLIDETCAAPGN